MESDQVFEIWIIAAVVSLLILYFIIRSAVKSANAGTEKLLRMLVKLKMEELKRQGATEKEIQTAMYSLKDI